MSIKRESTLRISNVCERISMAMNSEMSVNKQLYFERQETSLCQIHNTYRRVHTIHDMSINMSIDIVAPQMSIVRRCLHLNRHVVQQNHSTLKIYHYRNK